jgi:uncharacterized protein YcbK (DUF882 family)
MVALDRRQLLCCSLAAFASLAAPMPGLAEPPLQTSRQIHLTCWETGESFDGIYWAQGCYLPDALARLSWVLRDFRRNEAIRMDPALIDILAALAVQLRTRHRFLVTSAYRAPQTNALLRREGFPAAARSTHLLGKAVDVRLEGTPLSHLYRAARMLRGGGVGAYPGADFIHLDSGSVRLWSGPS